MIAEHGYFELPLRLVRGDMCTTMGRCGATNGVMTLTDAEHSPRDVTEAAAIAAHALERAKADLKLVVKTDVTNVTLQHDRDVSAPLVAAVQAVGIATTALHDITLLL